ncbi:hypothetical protein C0Q70_15181 [Pomacea canaliculata]|uniref:Uncharacterized protein n=1 Tax=Pomacea canaliculata TaxID=400727 RepID=A0A2T7NU81_POMCA|nr:hypothetical protein C0Q70_15181 [Pomacea canaliculata]
MMSSACRNLSTEEEQTKDGTLSKGIDTTDKYKQNEKRVESLDVLSRPHQSLPPDVPLRKSTFLEQLSPHSNSLGGSPCCSPREWVDGVAAYRGTRLTFTHHRLRRSPYVARAVLAFSSPPPEQRRVQVSGFISGTIDDGTSRLSPRVSDRRRADMCTAPRPGDARRVCAWQVLGGA